MEDSDTRLRVGWRGRGKDNTEESGKGPATGENGLCEQSNDLDGVLFLGYGNSEVGPTGNT